MAANVPVTSTLKTDRLAILAQYQEELVQLSRQHHSKSSFSSTYVETSESDDNSLLPTHCSTKAASFHTVLSLLSQSLGMEHSSFIYQALSTSFSLVIEISARIFSSSISSHSPTSSEISAPALRETFSVLFNMSFTPPNTENNPSITHTTPAIRGVPPSLVAMGLDSLGASRFSQLLRGSFPCVFFPPGWLLSADCSVFSVVSLILTQDDKNIKNNETKIEIEQVNADIESTRDATYEVNDRMRQDFCRYALQEWGRDAFLLSKSGLKQQAKQKSLISLPVLEKPNANEHDEYKNRSDTPTRDIRNHTSPSQDLLNDVSKTPISESVLSSTEIETDPQQRKDISTSTEDVFKSLNQEKKKHERCWSSFCLFSAPCCTQKKEANLALPSSNATITNSPTHCSDTALATYLHGDARDNNSFMLNETKRTDCLSPEYRLLDMVTPPSAEVVNAALVRLLGEEVRKKKDSIQDDQPWRILSTNFVILTGSTGFLGSRILSELVGCTHVNCHYDEHVDNLKNTQSKSSCRKVIALVRSHHQLNDDREYQHEEAKYFTSLKIARDRLRNHLQRVGLLPSYITQESEIHSHAFDWNAFISEETFEFSSSLSSQSSQLPQTSPSFSLCEQCWTSRVFVIPCDLSLASLGLPLALEKSSFPTYIGLSKLLPAVVHCAAEVHHTAPFTSLFVSNVVATQALLLFSTAVAVLREREDNHFSPSAFTGFHLVSTMDTVDGGSYGGLPLSISQLSNRSGYAQTKWVAERLSVGFCRLYGIPCSVFNPGYITVATHGTISSSASFAWDFPLQLLSTCALTGSFPPPQLVSSREAAFPYAANLYPVDSAAKAIVTLATVCSVTQVANGKDKLTTSSFFSRPYISSTLFLFFDWLRKRSQTLPLKTVRECRGVEFGDILRTFNNTIATCPPTEINYSTFEHQFETMVDPIVSTIFSGSQWDAQTPLSTPLARPFSLIPESEAKTRNGLKHEIGCRFLLTHHTDLRFDQFAYFVKRNLLSAEATTNVSFSPAPKARIYISEDLSESSIRVLKTPERIASYAQWLYETILTPIFLQVQVQSLSLSCLQENVVEISSLLLAYSTTLSARDRLPLLTLYQSRTTHEELKRLKVSPPSISSSHFHAMIQALVVVLREKVNRL